MKAKSCMMVAVAAGAACTAFASEPQLAEALNFRHAGHVYVNMRTGERVVTLGAPAGGTSRFGDGVFVNQDNAANGNFFFGNDNPTRAPTIPALGSEVGDWGDIPFNTVVDGIGLGYATNAGLEIAPVSSLPGFTLIQWYYDCDGGLAASEVAVPAAGLALSSAPGAYFSTGFTGWTFTFDFEPTTQGYFFEIGDNDGSASGAFQINGPNQGCDLDDTDGNPKADFGWGYTFIQGQTQSKGTTGPYLVLPASADIIEDDDFPTGGGGNADGVRDVFTWWTTPTNPNTAAPRTGRFGNYWFGGWPTNPYASFMMTMYGTAGGGGNPCDAADYNGDTEVDIQDFLDFFGDYGPCEFQTTPCPDALFDVDRYNPDGFVDIQDFLGFFDIFGQCS